MADENVTLNIPTTSGLVIRGVNYGDAVVRQVIKIDVANSGGPESIVGVGGAVMPVNISSSSTAIPVTGSGTFTVQGTVTSVSKTPLTFRQQLTTTQTNTALSGPGVPFTLIAIHICSKAYDPPTTGYDNPSILIGVADAVTPTGSGVVYAHPGFPPGKEDGIALSNGLVTGTTTNHVLITTGTIATDVLEIFGVYFLN